MKQSLGADVDPLEVFVGEMGDFVVACGRRPRADDAIGWRASVCSSSAGVEHPHAPDGPAIIGFDE